MYWALVAGQTLCSAATLPQPPQPRGSAGKGVHGSVHTPQEIRPIRPCRVDTDENCYPQKLAFAQCLCMGCINANMGHETIGLTLCP